MLNASRANSTREERLYRIARFPRSQKPSARQASQSQIRVIVIILSRSWKEPQKSQQIVFPSLCRGTSITHSEAGSGSAAHHRATALEHHHINYISTGSSGEPALSDTASVQVKSYMKNKSRPIWDQKVEVETGKRERERGSGNKEFIIIVIIITTTTTTNTTTAIILYYYNIKERKQQLLSALLLWSFDCDFASSLPSRHHRHRHITSTRCPTVDPC